MSIAGGRLAAGDDLVGYRVEVLLGRGGMGEVYRAHDERLDRPVALKVLAERVAGDERLRERIMRESRLAASVDHPNVVPVYEAGELDGRVFIAMRYVEGTDLRALLRRDGALPPERTIAVATQLAAALDAAHERGLVHRDVKPSNVLLDERGHCYLADFGLTEPIAQATPQADGHLLGTLDYVAPEQIRGDAVDGRADVYSLSCLLFECLTGEVPYPRPSDVATIFGHLEDEPPLASERRPRLPVAVDAVLACGMAKDPAARYDSSGALVDDLRAALGLGPAAPARRHWALGAAAAVVLLATAAVAAVLATRGGGTAAATAGSLVRIDPTTNEVAATTRVPGHPASVTASTGGIWIADFRDGVLWRYEPNTGALQRVPSSGEPRDLAALGDDVYVASDGPRLFSGTVSRYDADSAVREDGITLLACAVAAGEGVVWAAGCPFVERLSTDDGRLRKLKEIFLPFASPRTAENNRVQFRELAIGGGSLWVLGDPLDRRLWRLDARSGDVLATIPLGFPPRTVAFSGGGVWITDPLHDTVVRVDPRDNSVGRPVRVGRGASGVAAGAGGVWIANALDGTVTRLDPRTGRTVATIAVAGLPREVAVGRGAVWVTTHAP